MCVNQGFKNGARVVEKAGDSAPRLDHRPLLDCAMAEPLRWARVGHVTGRLVNKARGTKHACPHGGTAAGEGPEPRETLGACMFGLLRWECVGARAE